MDFRSKMIRDIRLGYGLDDELVLSSMKRIPRHDFVDAGKAFTYSDSPVSIGYNQTMSQPYTVAYMTHLLTENHHKEIKHWKVLEIGTGSGYQAAVLSKIVGKVYTVEIIPELADKAKRTLKKLGYRNVDVKRGSGEFGWKKYAPYDAIIVTAALEKEIPVDLITQLKTGGVIVAPVGPKDLQTMTRFTKNKKGKLEKEEFGKFTFVPFVKEK